MRVSTVVPRAAPSILARDPLSWKERGRGEVFGAETLA
jgi:hypothetical protein